ncbi:MAG: hypothetical protein ACKVRO_12475 [Micropepsaceae bacterium]
MKLALTRRSIALGTLSLAGAAAAQAHNVQCHTRAHFIKVAGREPFALEEIRRQVANVEFAQTSSVPESVSERLDYFRVETDERDLTEGGLFIVGLMTVKQPGALEKESGTQLGRGDYIHWIGRTSGSWIGGFASRLKRTNAIFPVRFRLSSGLDEHEHVTVWTHSPQLALAIGPLPTPPVPPRPPRDDRRHGPPPRPPAACFKIWHKERIPGTRNPPQYFCADGGWVQT